MNKIAKQLTGELDAMWHFALRLTANRADAEDLVQRTCVKALENAADYQEQGRIRSWLFQIEHRIWLNVLRKRQIRDAGSFRRTSISDDSYDESAPESFKGLEPEAFGAHLKMASVHSPESQLRLHQVFEQVESLPEVQRLVVALVCVEGFTYQETAQILDIPIGTVMSRLARARITLGEAILQGNAVDRTAEVNRGTRQ